MKVELTYFKIRGKYYSGGFFYTEHKLIHHIWMEVQEKMQNRTLPGLKEGHGMYYVTVNVPEHEHNHPRLMVMDDYEKEIDI